MNANHPRILELKERQAKWMTERRAVMEEETTNRGVSGSTPVFSSFSRKEESHLPPSKANNYAPEAHHQNRARAPNHDLLNRLTEKIAIRIRTELQDQLGFDTPLMSSASSPSTPPPDNQNEEYTHCCQICFELMSPPDKTPTMLFPCGHSFCKDCVKQHEKKSALTRGGNARCPYCRKEIEHVAENQMLKQLIEIFVGETANLERGGRVATNARSYDGTLPSPRIKNDSDCHQGLGGDFKHQPQATDESSERKFVAHHKSCSIRHRILSNELEDIHSELARSRERREGIRYNTSLLRNEKIEAERCMETLRKQLQLVETSLGTFTRSPIKIGQNLSF